MKQSNKQSLCVLLEKKTLVVQKNHRYNGGPLYTLYITISKIYLQKYMNTTELQIVFYIFLLGTLNFRALEVSNFPYKF